MQVEMCQATPYKILQRGWVKRGKGYPEMRFSAFHLNHMGDLTIGSILGDG